MTPEERLKVIEKKMITQSCKNLELLIKKLDNLKTNNILDRWMLYKCLLLEMPLLEALHSETVRQKQLVNKVRKTINKLAPSFDFGAYSQA